MKRRDLLQALPAALLACAPPPVPPPPRPSPPPPPGGPKTGADRIASCVHDIGERRALCPSPARETRSAIYDDALVVLVLLRAGKYEEAERILLTLAAAQYSDGSITFNLDLTLAPGAPYTRSGALAWVGYAATEFLDAAPVTNSREKILALAHRSASYLLARQIPSGDDPRSGLVLGGRGTYRYDRAGLDLREVFVDGERDWASVEHNIDAFFFLKALARITEDRSYADAAARIAAALNRVAWDEERGQFIRGVTADGRDRFFALDCASWGGLFLLAIGDRRRAERCLAEAESVYRAESRGVRGHKPYSSGPLIESWALRQQASEEQRKADWSTFQVVWPEGSAGVALLAARLGRLDRAREILRDLEPLRNGDGSLPTASDDVENELDRKPAIGGTAWVEIVRIELEQGRPTFWR